MAKQTLEAELAALVAAEEPDWQGAYREIGAEYLRRVGRMSEDDLDVELADLNRYGANSFTHLYQRACLERLATLAAARERLAERR